MNKLMRLDPFPSLFPSTFFDQFEKMFGGLDFYNPERQSWKLSKFPRGDLYVEDDKGVVELALAGYSKDQLSIQVEDNKVHVTATKAAEETSKESRSIARRSFTEDYYFGPEFDLGNISAEFKDGLLRIEVPKVKPEVAVVKDVQIK